MYQSYAQHHGWSFDILEYMTSDLGQFGTETCSYMVLCGVV